MNTCDVKDCVNICRSRKSKVCEKHYYRIRRRGSTNKYIPDGFNIGSTFNTNSCGKVKIIKYVNSQSVTVEFLETGTMRVASSFAIKNGDIKDSLSPCVFGVGYVGHGKHRPTENGRRTVAYSRWSNMLRRCYDKNKNYVPGKYYKNVVVCNEWHNFQAFAEWFNANYIDGCDIDKDMLSGKNKIYSPSTCCFVTRETNSLVATNALGREYKIVKDDVFFKFHNIAKASRELKIDSGNLCRLVNGKIASLSGWRLVYAKK